jgi:hypothetical protein
VCGAGKTHAALLLLLLLLLAGVHAQVYGFGDADGAPADVSIPTMYDVYLRP